MASLDAKELANLDKQTLITLLISSNEALEKLQLQVSDLNKTISVLTEEVHGLRAWRFGRSSEKNIVENNGYYQYSLFVNEDEVNVDLHPDMQEPELEEICPKPYVRGKKTKGKRAEDLKDLPVTVIEHTLPEEKLLEAFPDGKWKRLPDETYSKLVFHPASFAVEEHHIAVYAGHGDKDVVRADHPKELIDKSIASASLVAGIANAKFINSQPTNRVAQEFERMDVSIPTQNLSRWLIIASDRYISRLYFHIKAMLAECHVVHADETPVEVNRDGRPAGTNSYMWVYRSGPYEPNPFILYDFQKTRKTDHPREFLKDFKGVCVTDGYQVYHSIADDREDLIIAGCWVHARRKFADVVKALTKEQKQQESFKESTANKALGLIRTINGHEKEISSKPPEERLEIRKTVVTPLVDAFFAYLKKESWKVAPKSATGKAITYCLNQEKYLRVFLTDPYVPFDNNAAERSIRPFCLGKKNWYVIDTISGAQSTAVWYSIAETAKANNLKPYEYFKYLLEELPQHGEYEDLSYLDDLLPWSEALPEKCREPAESAK